MAQSVADAEAVVAAAAGRRPDADGRPPARVPPRRRQAQGADRRAASSGACSTSTATASTSASCAPTRTRCGRSARTTSRCCCGSPARSRTRSRRAARATCARASRTSCSASCASRPASPPTCTCRWLDPHKERRFTVVGEQRMATFDDMALEGKITVYDKGFDEQPNSYGEYITRSGDIWSPRLSNVEPLRTECEHFVRAMREGTRADLRRRRRPARRARARGAPAVARRDAPRRASRARSRSTGS